jgi:hypothetical protein
VRPLKSRTAGTPTLADIFSAISGVRTADPPRSRREMYIFDRLVVAARSANRSPAAMRAMRSEDGL